MSLIRLTARFAAALFFAACATTVPPAAAETQACGGRNLLDEIKAADAATYKTIRDAADATANARHLLWKIEQPSNPDRPPSFLFGTVHLTDERVIAMPDAARQALDASRRIALEVEDISPARIVEAMATLRDQALLPGNARLDKLLTEGETKRTAALLKRAGLPPEVASRVRPWVAQLAVNVSECERSRMGNGRPTLDAEIARLAEDRGVGAFGLETVELQFQSLAAVPEADQLAVLKASLGMYERIDDLIETQIQLYLKRDIGAMWPLQLALARKHGVAPEAYAAYGESLLVARSQKMRDRATGHLQVGGVFIAVGALHLPGKAGLVALFEEVGFKLTPIE